MQAWAALSRDLPALAFGFMLVVARVGMTLLTGPGLGETEIPASVRAALAVAFSALVYPLLRGALPPVPREAAVLVSLVALEIVIGAWIGFLARALALALSMAGAIISLMVGLSSVLQLDPSVGAQVAAMQRMLALAATALLFATGLYMLPVRAIVGSYDLIPPGSLFDTGGFDAGGAALVATRAVAEGFGLALRLAAPFVITTLVWQVALGFLSRLVPNIQVHLISAPAQIMSGLALLAAAVLVMFTTWSAGMLSAFSALPGL